MYVYIYMCIYTYLYITGVPGSMVLDQYFGRYDPQCGTGPRCARLCPAAGMTLSAGGPSLCQGLPLQVLHIHACISVQRLKLPSLRANRSLL